MTQSGLVINSVTDLASGEVNASINPGGALGITGSKIKIAGDDALIVLFLINQDSGEVIRISITSTVINEPSKITCIISQDLALAKYKPSITTQFFSNKTLLKELRSFNSIIYSQPVKQ